MADKFAVHQTSQKNMAYGMTESKLAVIGLGYVGLPLAVEFAKQYAVVGYDISRQRIQALNKGADTTREVESEQLTSLIKERNDDSKGL